MPSSLTKLKKCISCNKKKNKSSFHKDKYTKDGLRPECSACRNKKLKKYYRNPPPTSQRNIKNRLRPYNITPEQFNKLLKQQDYCCAICQTMFKDLGRGLCVDHDHESGQVRLLLCVSCNWGLGNFRDNTELLMRAICYLKNFDDTTF